VQVSAQLTAEKRLLMVPERTLQLCCSSCVKRVHHVQQDTQPVVHMLGHHVHNRLCVLLGKSRPANMMCLHANDARCNPKACQHAGWGTQAAPGRSPPAQLATAPDMWEGHHPALLQQG
jgi:hypothetical protein